MSTLALLLSTIACTGASGADGETDASSAASQSDADASSGAESNNDSTSVDTDSGDGDSGDGDSGDGDSGDGDGDLPETCQPPLDLYDTTSPDHVIGQGTPQSCTGADLKAAAEQGGTIVFDCGDAPVTIALDETIVLPIDADTIIDGEGLVTLDAQGQTRHFLFDHPDWMNNPTKIVLQRMRFINGAAPPGEYFDQDPANPDCAYGYKEGSGGVLYVRNGTVHILDSHFVDNAAALIGPDVGGGAVYVVGVPEIVISGSSFVGNRAANGGAVGMLFANPRVFNTRFEDNQALGIGQNYVEPGCPNFNHDEQGGAGGNSGAMYFDGLSDEGQVFEICGVDFVNNKANELGGALFRTPNAGVRNMHLDRCWFDSNTARMGGVSFLKDQEVRVDATTFSNNRSGVNVAGDELGGPHGGLWIVDGNLELDNSTFVNNQPNGVSVEGGSASFRNATFDNSPIGGSGGSVRNTLFVDTICSSALAGQNNLQWPDAAPCAMGTNFADPQLGALSDNGGPTPTAMPGSASVEGIASDCPPNDQRGEARDASSCAAGAVEPSTP